MIDVWEIYTRDLSFLGSFAWWNQSLDILLKHLGRLFPRSSFSFCFGVQDRSFRRHRPQVQCASKTMHILHRPLLLLLPLLFPFLAFASPLQPTRQLPPSLAPALPSNSSLNTTLIGGETPDDYHITSHFDRAHMYGARYPIANYLSLLSSCRTTVAHRSPYAKFLRVWALHDVLGTQLQVGFYNPPDVRPISNREAGELLQLVARKLQTWAAELKARGLEETLPDWCWANFMGWDVVSVGRGWIGSWPSGVFVHPCGYTEVHSLSNR